MNRSRPRAAFTLVEVLLALVLLAALLASVNQFIFSITEAWTRDHERFVFAQHARAVTRHLEEMFRLSAASSWSSNTTAGAPGVVEVRLPEGGTAELVTFDLPDGDRLITWPGRSLPEVQCALGWRQGEGLMLYYKSRLEENFDAVNPRQAVVSPFVTGLVYEYYDADTDTWSSETALLKRDNALVTPRRLRLRFQRGGQDYTEVITLPVRSEGVPAY